MSENFTPTVSKTGFTFRLPDSGSDEMVSDHDRRVERLVKARLEAPSVDTRERQSKPTEAPKADPNPVFEDSTPTVELTSDKIQDLLDSTEDISDEAKSVLKMLAATGVPIHAIR